MVIVSIKIRLLYTKLEYVFAYAGASHWRQLATLSHQPNSFHQPPDIITSEMIQAGVK